MVDTHETIADIVAEMRFHGQQNIDAEKDKPEYGILTMEGRIARNYADRLEAAYKREIDVLKQRCAELNAEIAAKDAVIMRLNDALAEEQRRKMATAEKSSAVGNAAKLREALCEILSYIESFHKYITPGKGEKLTALFAVADTIRNKARAALAAPPRNCDRFGGDIDKLREACARERGLNPEEDFPDVFPGWLLAPSTEKKGGKDGNK